MALIKLQSEILSILLPGSTTLVLGDKDCELAKMNTRALSRITHESTFMGVANHEYVQ